MAPPRSLRSTAVTRAPHQPSAPWTSFPSYLVLLSNQLGPARRAVPLFVRPNIRRVSLTFMLSLAVAAAAASEPLLLKQVVDRLGTVTPGAADATLHAIAAGVALFALVLTCRILGAAWVTTSTWAVRLNLEYQLRSHVAAKMSVLSASTQSDLGTGGLRYAIDSSSPQTASAFTDVAFKLLPTLVYVSLATWGMARLDGAITAIVICLLPVPAIVAAVASRQQRRRERMQHAFWKRLWSGYTERLHGMGTVRAFARERDEEKRLMRRIRWAFASIQRGVHVDARTTVAAGIAELTARVVVLCLGGWLVVRGELTVGSLLAFLGYVSGVFAPVQQIVDLYPTLRKAHVALTSVFQVLDAEEESPDLPDAIPCPPITGQVRFERVSFAYRNGHRALEDVDLTVEAGETVALVGPSGSGKSTILQLLQRIHNPTSGRILIDGLDLRSLRIATVRRQYGAVPQDVVLFNDSVAANISYGRPSATRAEVVAAAQAANAHDFILNLAKGYDTRVGEGGRALSGGQRQRVAIARAFLVDPVVLLLDEATAALDTESELAIQDALRSLRRGRTTFIVAHRLNTVRDADRILVIVDGRVAGSGAHDDLLVSCPTYATLVRHQLGAAPGPVDHPERAA
jgi:ATP-binding cassette subfamily B protein